MPGRYLGQVGFTDRRILTVPRAATRRRPLLVVLACAVIGLSTTTLVTISAVQRERTAAANETDARLLTIGDAIDRQVSRYAETLYGLRGAFAKDPRLNRDEFHALVDFDSLLRRNPGAESVTFDRFVASSDLAAFEAQARAQVPGFTVHPRDTDPKTEHVVVDFIEPPDPHSPAVGLDIAAEPIRTSALQFARDTGELSATQPIDLVQEPSGPGFLLMLAAYDVSPVPVTKPARSRHFLGVLVTVFAADAMVDQAAESRPDLPVSIYDAGPTVADPRTAPRPDDWIVGTPTEHYTNYVDIDVGSRRWRLVTDAPVATNTDPAKAALTAGLALTLLVAGLFTAIAVSRRRALTLADRMTVDLRASEGNLRGFIDVAAHDLRSPLASIAGFSALLADSQVDLSEEEKRSAIGSIERQSAHMGRLIEDLLTVSSIDGGALLPHPEPIPLAAAIDECVQSDTALAESVSISCSPELVVFADTHHLRRILDNYLQNALKYGSPPIQVVAVRAGDQVEVRVLDHGPGVPEEFAPSMFDKFARAQTPKTRAQPGTGLGLSIVRGLAEANGGRATYEPNRPHGSCFVVTLPAHRDGT